MSITKVRQGFVTNSSSSSFILGFKDENNIAQALADDHTYHYFREIYNDCQKAEKMSLDEAINKYSDEIKYHIKWDLEHKYDDEYRKKYHKWASYEEIKEWQETEEYKKLYQEELNRRTECIKNKAKENNYSTFVEVEYCDHDSSELEHDIMPDLNCCLARISHH